MTYVYSRARKTFNSAIERLVLASREADSDLCTSTKVRAMAHANAIILTSTYIEGYLEDLILDWAAAMGSAGLNAAILPKETRAFLLAGPATKNAYRKLFLLDHGEREFLTILSAQLGEAGESCFAIDSTVVRASQLEKIVRDVRYPSEANLKKLFARCGIKDLFTTLNTVAKRNVLPLHTSFSDLRTEIAHKGLPVGINGRDVRLRIREIASLVGYLDRAFYNHCKKLYGLGAWTT